MRIAIASGTPVKRFVSSYEKPSRDAVFLGYSLKEVPSQIQNPAVRVSSLNPWGRTLARSTILTPNIKCKDLGCRPAVGQAHFESGNPNGRVPTQETSPCGLGFRV